MLQGCSLMGRNVSAGLKLLLQEVENSQMTTRSIQQNMLSGQETMAHYASVLGGKKVGAAPAKLFMLAVVAGLMISFGAVAAVLASHAVANSGLARLIGGAIFPIGLAMVMLMGTELFTGNTMIFISVLDGRATVAGMLKNWVLVYLGNLVGALLLAAAIVYSGHLNLNGGALAIYTIKTAVAKCSLSFGPAVVLGVLCNIMVCLGVLCSLTADDTSGRILGAYFPVALFIIGGFEHCVANMYYIQAGIFASARYASLAAAAGVDTSALTWGNMFITNLLPVTIGNILGGAGTAVLLWLSHCGGGRKH